MEKFELGNFDKMEFLLKSKSFDELTEAEKEFVCKNINCEEYDNLFYFYQNTNQVSANTLIEPDEEIKIALDKKFQEETTKPTIPFFSRKLSVIKVAAVAIVCFMLGFGIKTIDTAKQKTETLTDSIIHDTIQVIKYIQLPQYKFFAKTKTISKSKLFSLDFPELQKNYYHEKDAILLVSQTMKLYHEVKTVNLK